MIFQSDSWTVRWHGKQPNGNSQHERMDGVRSLAPSPRAAGAVFHERDVVLRARTPPQKDTERKDWPMINFSCRLVGNCLRGLSLCFFLMVFGGILDTLVGALKRRHRIVDSFLWFLLLWCDFRDVYRFSTEDFVESQVSHRWTVEFSSVPSTNASHTFPGKRFEMSKSPKEHQPLRTTRSEPLGIHDPCVASIFDSTRQRIIHFHPFPILPCQAMMSWCLLIQRNHQWWRWAASVG